MVDEEQDEEGQVAEAPVGKSSKKMLLIAAGLLLLVVAIGTPIAFFALKEDSKPDTSQAELPADAVPGLKEEIKTEGFNDEDEYGEDEEQLGAIFPMQTFVVNLADSNNYLRCQIQIEFMDRDIPLRFYGRVVPVRDKVIEILTSRTADELSSLEGKEELKSVLRDSINGMMKKEDVKTVYFTQFVIQ